MDGERKRKDKADSADPAHRHGRTARGLQRSERRSAMDRRGHAHQGGKPVFAIGRLVQERCRQEECGHDFDRDRCGTNGYQRIHGYVGECITGLCRAPANGIVPVAGFWKRAPARAKIQNWIDDGANR
jgi:hypothetical protein